MATADLSFSNPSISNYFNAKTESPPVAELLYLHTHPLVQPNFLGQIEELINITGDMMEQKAMTGKPVDRLTTLTSKLGRRLPVITNENAPEILDILRDIYRLCCKLTGVRELRV
jgi:hypothetical protein